MNFIRRKLGEVSKALLLISLVIVAVAAQPLLAIPALCQMPGKCASVSCAACCAVNPCCAPSDQQQSSPLNAVLEATASFLPAITSQRVSVPMPTVQQIDFPKFARASSHAHAPPPLALNCIQLI